MEQTKVKYTRMDNLRSISLAPSTILYRWTFQTQTQTLTSTEYKYEYQRPPSLVQEGSASSTAFLRCMCIIISSLIDCGEKAVRNSAKFGGKIYCFGKVNARNALIPS